VKFISHNTKVEVSKKKKLLKERKSEFKINKHLTSRRIEAMKKINERAKGDFKKMWSIDETIFVRLNDDKIMSLRSLADLEEFINLPFMLGVYCK